VSRWELGISSAAPMINHWKAMQRLRLNLTLYSCNIHLDANSCYAAWVPPAQPSRDHGGPVTKAALLHRQGRAIMAYVFGPVRSRRLGRSLGIDPIPLKTCNWNCVYCQLGRTVPLTNSRTEYCPAEAVLIKLRQALDISDGIDWITFVGSGEPTLHARIGWLIRQAKGLTDIPVAVITNGSLLHIPEVAQELAAADAVLPTLDAGDAALYRRINRPHPALSYDSLRQGLITFRHQYGGLFWLEVMLVKGLNDSESALQSLAAALGEIEPDEVHINVPFRAPAESWVRVPARDTLRRARELIGSRARLIDPAPADFRTRRTNIVDSLAEVVARHPLPEEEVRATFAVSGGDPDAAVGELASDKRVARVERHGHVFWCPSRATYAKRPADAIPVCKDSKHIRDITRNEANHDVTPERTDAT